MNNRKWVVIPLIIILGEIFLFHINSKSSIEDVSQITNERVEMFVEGEYNYTHGFNPIFAFTAPPILFIISSHVVVSRSALVTILMDENQKNQKYANGPPNLQNANSVINLNLLI